jgi:hypothetical protein
MNFAINVPAALSYNTIEPWRIIYGGLDFVKKKLGLINSPWYYVCERPEARIEPSLESRTSIKNELSLYGFYATTPRYFPFSLKAS